MDRWVAASVLALPLVAPLGCAPASYASYNSPDGTFACDYPDGWEAKGAAKRGVVWAKFRAGDALIDVQTSVSGSLMSDAMGGRTRDPALPLELEPVHLLHVGGAEAAADAYSAYTELPGSPVEMDCEIGPARLSEFTASGTFGAQLHGYRVTTIGRKRSVHVFCVCREQDWAALKPAFDQTLTSLAKGVAE